MPDESKEERLAKMDAAAHDALVALDKLIKDMTGAQEEGAQMLVGWLQDSYRTAGYKRLLSRGIFKHNPFAT